MILKGNVKHLPKGLVEDLKAHNECIMNVMLVNFDRTNSIQALSVLKNITKLVIKNYHEDDVFDIIDLPHLRHLELIQSMRFAEVINTQTLNVLKIFGQGYSGDCYSTDWNTGLNKFLSKCHNLKDLTFSKIQIVNPNLKSECFVFNLEALTIEYSSFDEENLAEFLVKQKNSLRKLSILNDLPKPIISTIIYSQLTLDELDIKYNCEVPSTFNPQMVNRTIKKLTSWTYKYHNNEDNTESDIKKIISICNAVEEFTFLDYPFDSLLQHLNWNLKNLKVLRIKTIPKLTSPTIELDNFETLEVIEIDGIGSGHGVESCKRLIINCSNLKTLKINYMERNIFKSNFFRSK